jgi:hypothetical protein
MKPFQDGHIARGFSHTTHKRIKSVHTTEAPIISVDKKGDANAEQCGSKGTWPDSQRSVEMHLRFTLNRPSLVVALVFQSLLYKHEYTFMLSYQPHTMMLQ